MLEALAEDKSVTLAFRLRSHVTFSLERQVERINLWIAKPKGELDPDPGTSPEITGTARTGGFLIYSHYLGVKEIKKGQILLLQNLSFSRVVPLRSLSIDRSSVRQLFHVHGISETSFRKKPNGNKRKQTE